MSYKARLFYSRSLQMRWDAILPRVLSPHPFNQKVSQPGFPLCSSSSLRRGGGMAMANHHQTHRSQSNRVLIFAAGNITKKYNSVGGEQALKLWLIECNFCAKLNAQHFIRSSVILLQQNLFMYLHLCNKTEIKVVHTIQRLECCLVCTWRYLN